jgi:hypothetical protein
MLYEDLAKEGAVEERNVNISRNFQDYPQLDGSIAQVFANQENPA